jgi:hypothetical protein
MRVQLTGSRADEGTVAVVVAALVLPITILAGFTADFGTAYAGKHQLQTAADAAALAAAAEFNKYDGMCEEIAGDPVKVKEANDVASSYRKSNQPGSTEVEFAAQCSGDGKAIDVTYVAESSVETTFGRLAGVSQLTAQRSGTARLYLPEATIGLRPYAVCMDDLMKLNPAGPVRVDFPNPACGDQAAGDWYSVDCPESIGVTSAFAEKTRNGCTEPITVATTPDACANGAAATPYDCLGGNQAELDEIADAWDYLLGKSIVLPVFSETDDGRYPVNRMVAVEVCGYHWGSEKNHTTAGDCIGADSGPDDNENYLLLRLSRLVVSGTHRESDCAIGETTCDPKARAVRLVG